VKKALLIACLALAFIPACRKERVQMQRIDLLSHGIPVIILAPDCAVI
jgi:hypothetical protein